MWITRYFGEKKHLDKWISRNKNKYRYNVIFVDNEYAVEYKELKHIGW
jgi:hypothetical protein